jgi:hypothetical protein
MKTAHTFASTLLAGALALGALPASAIPVVLDFEGATNGAALNDFYNGGTDAAGASGVNVGINFSSTSLALVDQDAGGTGNFGNEPSPNTILFFLSGGAATMNVAAGFSGGFSFFYTSSATGFVNVYEGLNGGGALLATINLAPNIGACSGDPTGSFCTFSPIGVAFAGTARSVDFGGTADRIGFDNITLGAATPGGSVPEPGTGVLLGLAAAGIVLVRRRRKARFFAPR